MYELLFNTRDFHSRRNRQRWEDLLKNDFAVAINGKKYTCETDEDLYSRFKIIDGQDISCANEDYLNLVDERYGTQRLLYGMYGIPQGYVSFDDVLAEVKKSGFIRIPFSQFYDIRQNNFKFFEYCYIEIKKI